MLEKLLTLLFPRRCVGCQTSGSYLCTICREELEPATDPDTPHTHAVFSYREPLIRTLVKKLKYKKTKDVAHTIADILYDYFLEEISEINQLSPTVISPEDKILVIPVPMHPLRMKERGYNQALEIAKHFAHKDPTHLSLVVNLLIKTRSTDSQVTVKNRSKRLANLKNAFAVNKISRLNLPAQAGLDETLIILIDDVITTGATMEEAMRTLKQAGARHVVGLALAHG
ncbi:MAG: phosphoribosyltransferase family protein [bacterium]